VSLNAGWEFAELLHACWHARHWHVAKIVRNILESHLKSALTRTDVGFGIEGMSISAVD